MKFSTRHDIEAPIGFVFEHASDFDGHLRQALRRGINVRRVDTLGVNTVGMCWNAGFEFRGKQRKIDGQLTQIDAPNGFQIQSVSGGLESAFDVELLQLSPGRTRILAGLDIRPKTLSSRLLIQSLKLGKNRLDERFARRVASFAREIEDRYPGAPTL